MKQHFKRTLAMLLAIVMIFGMLPVSALADGTEATFSLTTNAVEPKIGDTFAVDCNLQSVTSWDAVELQILWNPAVLRFDGFARKLNEDDEPVLDSTALATGMAAVNDEIGRIAWASANLRSKSGKAFTANFTVIGAGPCNLALDKGSVIFSGHDIDITHDFDESAVAGLTVTADEPVHVHSLTAHEPVEPTVEAEGSSAYWSCECGKFFADAEGELEIDENSWIIPRLPAHTHTLTAHEGVEPTCGRSGSNAYWSCECGKFFNDAEGELEINENSWVLPATGEHIDEKNNGTNANGKDGLCDLCGEYCNRAPVLQEGVEAVTENVVAGEAYLLRDLQAGRIFTDPDGDRLSVAGGGAGNAESSTCFYYNRSTDNGETWSEELDFAGALFGATTISLTEREPGTYLYRFYAKDGYGGDSREAGDYWYLTLNVDEPENLNFDIEFYIGKDQNYAANGNRMPVIKLWASDGSSNKVGEEIALTAVEPENDYARVNASVPGGWYVYEGYGWNTETEAYDIPLGGMQIKLPADANVDGAAAGGTKIYLRVMAVYTSSKKADGTYFGAQDYTARVTCPIMQCDAVMGAPYQSGNYTYYPVLFYAGGNSCLFNTYLYPTDTENYMFSQSINGTLPAGTSVQNKSATINSVELLTVTVPADADFSLYFQYNNFNTSEQLPVVDWTLNADGTKTATYKVSKSNGNYSWRMTDANGVYVTKAGWLTSLTAARSMTLSFDGASTDRNSHSFAALGTTTATRDEADLQVFVSATGAKAVAGTERIRAYRMWQLINSDTANIMIEPDYVWTKLTGPADISFAEDACGELTGNQIDGGNSFHNWADITANGGTSIFAVHYKALDVDLNNATHGGFYPANNPDRTAFVVIADALGSATADVRFNGDFTGNSRLPGWDYIYDTWYYLNGEEDPALTFTANGAECVEYAFGTTNGNMQSSVSSFTEISAADGVYSVPLATLNNAAYNYGGTVIIRMTDASGVYSYQLVKVARMTVTVTNRSYPGEPAMPGNTVVLGFDGLYRSINKISGIFNPTTFYLRYTIDGQEVNGTLGQYQQMDRSSITLTLPTDVTFAEGENTAVVHANNGYVFGSMYSAANPFAAMYYMTDVGVGTNFNAVTVSFAFQKLSDIPITVSKMPTVAVTLNVVNSDSAVLTLTDAAGAVQTAENGVYTLPLGTFHYTVEADGFIKEVGKFNVSMADGDTKTVDITLRAADANTWDGSSAAVTPNADGVYEIRTGAELAWFAAQVNSGAGVNWNAKLMNDISLNWKSWTPIGSSSKKYAGTFDGNGHVITDLYINSTDTYQGLFGYVSAATVKNLGVTGSVASTNNNVGGIIGYTTGVTVVENCFNAADVTGKQGVGGIVGGAAAATGKINNCYNVGTITATSKYGGGINGAGASVSMCATATNCYNVGTVNSAANGGGINPGAASKAVNSYYLDTCYVTGTSAKAGTAKTADELKAMAATLGDAFAADTGINGGYPILKWQASCDHTPGEPIYAPAENGRHTVTVSCTLCGEVISTEEADCTFGEGVITTEATCTKDGVMTYTCTVCNGTKTEVIPAAGHVDDGFDGICDVCETVLGTVKTVNVSFTAQAAGAFLCAPAEGVEIASNLAERYGYADGISYLSGVSALDVLVAANIAVVGEEDFASAPQEFLTAGASAYGFSVTRLFGVSTANNGFAINRGYANDGTPSTYGGYNGYTVNNAPVADGDLVEFFLYQDSYASDNYTYLTVAEEAVAGTAFTVNVKGISFGWRGYEFATAEAMKAAATPIEGVSLAIVDKTTGALTDLEVETDKDGNVSVTIAQPGTVVLVAYGEDDTETPVIMTMTEITVAEPAGVPGDVNGDGVMDLTDVTLINRSLLPETHKLYKSLTADQLRLADVNGDGVVDLTDVTLINRALLPETHKLYRTLG